LFGVPYDYRFMSDEYYSSSGFIDNVKALIEKAYTINKGRRVFLIGHSNGGPTMYSFLTSKKVSQEWKDRYMAGMIGLSGNFLGQMNCITSFLYNPDSSNQEMAASWEANYGSVTWGGFEPALSANIVTTFANTPQEKNYSSSLVDVSQLFEDIGGFHV